MYSDDSAASEVESEEKEVYNDDNTSETADSLDTLEFAVALPKKVKNEARSIVSSISEEDEDGYSVDFEDDYDEEDEKDKPMTKLFSTQMAASPTRSVLRNAPSSVDNSNNAKSSYDYEEASFEEESHRSLGQRNTNTVDFPFQSGSPLTRPAPVPLAEKEETEALSTKHFSLLLRKVESKFEDEVEELREKVALLSWKERELKASLRRSKEELTMRKTRIERKRRRAIDRRREHERAAEQVQQDLAAAQASIAERDCRIKGMRSEIDELRGILQKLERDKYEAEGRSAALADKLQAALGDYHQLTCSFEEAANAKLVCEQRIEELKGMHRVECEVLRHKCQVDLEAANRALANEVEARTAERQTLPVVHERILEAEKERYEKLEAALYKQMGEIESRAAQNALAHAAELAHATEAKHQAEKRAEQRIHEEVDRIAREREAVDEQRRELLAWMARTNAWFDEERGKMEAKNCELIAQRSELADERTELEAHRGCIEQRARRLEKCEALTEKRRFELAAVGRETLEKSETLARRAQEFADAVAEREKLRKLVKILTERSERSEKRVMMLEQDRERFEANAQALQQERLLVAKQRMQSRYFLDGARKLESMLHQKHCVMEGTDKRQSKFKAASFASNQREHQTLC